MKRFAIILVTLVGAALLTAQPTPKRWASLGGPSGGNINAFAVAANGDLWAGTQSGGVYRLPAGTTTWVAVNSGLFHRDYGKVFLNVFDLAFAPNGDLYAAMNEGELYRLPNGSSTWLPMPSAGLPATANVLAVRVVGTDVFAGTNGAGVYRLASGATSWSSLSTGLPNTTSTTVTSFAVNASNRLVAGTNAGVYTLASGASTWAAEAIGSLSQYITDVIVDPATGRYWASTFQSGVYRKLPGDASWAAAPGMANPFVMSLAIDTNGDIYAGLQSGGCCGGVDRLSAGGTSWVGPHQNNFQNGLANYRQVRAITVTGGKVYAGTSRGVFRLDSGPVWTPLFNGMSAFRINALHRRPNGTILAGTEGGGIFSYTNRTWSDFNDGIDPGTIPAEITNITETGNGTLYATLRGSGIGRYVLRRTSGATSWSEFNGGIAAPSGSETLALVYNPSDDFVYIGIAPGGVYRTSGTSGSSWASLNTGLSDLSVASLLAAMNGDVYAGTVNGGVFRKPVAATSWSAFNAGALQPFNVLALGQNRVTGDLWATFADQQYRFPAGGSQWIADSEGFYGPDCPSADVHSFTSTANGVMWAANFCGAARRRYDSDRWRYTNDNLFPPNQGTNTAFSFVQKVHAIPAGVLAGMQGLPVKYFGSTRLVWRNANTFDTHVWLMEGGTFASAAVLPKAGVGWTFERWTDLDGDGFKELIVRNESLAMTHVWELDETGAFWNGGVLPTVSSQFALVGADDFNGDGTTDFLWRHRTTFETHMWLMNGTTIIGGAVLPPAGSSWSIAGTGDFNGDGRADIVWRNPSISQTHIWFMAGTAMSSAVVLPPAGVEWTLARVDDYDGDSRADLVWRHNSGQAHMWLMNGPSIKGAAVMPGISNQWQIAASGDFDGDGRGDIVWRNINTFDTHMWMMNGTVIGRGAVLPRVGGEWTLVP